VPRLPLADRGSGTASPSRWLVTFLAVVLSACGTGSATGASTALAAAEVIEVFDGDSFLASVDGVEEEVRLIGINAPERGECLADAAREALEELVGEAVELERDVENRDQYDRLLRYAHRSAVLVNAELAGRGLVLTGEYRPNVAHQETIEAAAAEARAEQRGLWSERPCGGEATGVVIESVVADPPGPDEGEESVVVANRGLDPVDIGGWTIRDGSSVHRFSFPAGTVLAPGSVIRVITGCDQAPVGALCWAAGSAVWDNDGDIAFLLDGEGRQMHSLDTEEYR
jgi:endonuclease YncB( thermonuclease family)